MKIKFARFLVRTHRNSIELIEIALPVGGGERSGCLTAPTGVGEEKNLDCVFFSRAAPVADAQRERKCSARKHGALLNHAHEGVQGSLPVSVLVSEAVVVCSFPHQARLVFTYIYPPRFPLQHLPPTHTHIRKHFIPHPNSHLFYIAISTLNHIRATFLSHLAPCYIHH